MIHLAQVAEFVNDKIIGQLSGQKNDPVTEVKILLGRAAPPAAFLIADADTIIGKIIKSIEMLQPRPSQPLRRTFIFQIIVSGPNCGVFTYFFSFNSYLVGEPILFRAQKPQPGFAGNPPWTSKRRWHRHRLAGRYSSLAGFLYLTVDGHDMIYNPNTANFILIYELYESKNFSQNIRCIRIFRRFGLCFIISLPL